MSTAPPFLVRRARAGLTTDGGSRLMTRDDERQVAANVVRRIETDDARQIAANRDRPLPGLRGRRRPAAGSLVILVE